MDFTNNAQDSINKLYDKRKLLLVKQTKTEQAMQEVLKKAQNSAIREINKKRLTHQKSVSAKT